jgi:hypothetical protein
MAFASSNGTPSMSSMRSPLENPRIDIVEPGSTRPSLKPATRPHALSG